MTKRHVDIDDAELRAAQAALGFTTIKATVSAGLRELAATEARRREVDRLGAGYLAEFADKSARQNAWQ